MINLNDITLWQGDCLELMKDIPDKSIDMVLCDLPFGTTKNHWDCVIPFEPLWEQYRRIIKDRGAIALFAQTPFDKILGASNIDMLKYEWIWVKDNATGFLNSKFAPLKIHENILIFSKSVACQVKDKSKAMIYNPQMRNGFKPYSYKKSCIESDNYGESKGTSKISNDGQRYPIDVIKYSRDKNKLHPNQKPVALLEYLIKTYTNTNDIVLDNCMGSGSTGVACINTDRRFIGIEKDESYFSIAKDRTDKAMIENDK